MPLFFHASVCVRGGRCMHVYMAVCTSIDMCQAEININCFPQLFLYLLFLDIISLINLELTN